MGRDVMTAEEVRQAWRSGALERSERLPLAMASDCHEAGILAVAREAQRRTLAEVRARVEAVRNGCGGASHTAAEGMRRAILAAIGDGGAEPGGGER